MSKKIKVFALILFVLGVMAVTVWFFMHTDVAVLNPKGEIAEKQRDILIFSVLLISIVVVPVFVLLGVFAWRYRDSDNNKHASYRPDWDNNKLLEIIWWGVPFVIISILAIVTWRTSHELDPWKSLSSSTKPVNIQVVALQWKWLFIYPEQKIASVNLLQIPEDTPINFTITADAPMNAFWIPSLGTQVYAMSGMSSKLSLNANEPGDYKGSSSNISGEGFADMAFVARASTKSDFDTWVTKAKQSPNSLDMTSYTELTKPGRAEKTTYKLKESDIYHQVVMKYMAPTEKEKHDSSKEEKTQSSGEMEHHDMGMMEMEGM